MTSQKFAKVLSANDAGSTGSHQAGILVPKSAPALLAFFPPLDPATKNPDAWLTCVDDNAKEWSLRYIYYNNELHDLKGTRNEYRITCLTPYLKQEGARAGDSLVFESTQDPRVFRISLERQKPSAPAHSVIQLRGWNRIC